MWTVCGLFQKGQKVANIRMFITVILFLKFPINSLEDTQILVIQF